MVCWPFDEGRVEIVYTALMRSVSVKLRELAPTLTFRCGSKYSFFAPNEAGSSVGLIGSSGWRIVRRTKRLVALSGGASAKVAAWLSRTVKGGWVSLKHAEFECSIAWITNGKSRGCSQPGPERA